MAATTSAAAASVSANGITDTANAVDTNNAASDVAAANGKSSSKLGAGGTAGIVLAILAVLALGAGLFIYRRRRQAERSGNNRKYGNVRIMSERYSNASSFYGVPNASSGSGGFITFQDNASTHTRTTHVATLPGSPSGGSMMYNAPAPAPDAAALSLRQEQPDEDDFSHYDQETVDTHGDLGQPSSTYYTPGQVTPYDSRAPRMPEYNLPHPPIPAFDGQEAILASKSSSSNMAYIASGRPAYRRAADERKGSNRSVSSQNSYVDEQLRDLYVDHY